MIEKIESVYSLGTAKYSEDGHFANLPFLGVVDGCSAPYNHKNPPAFFNGITGGQMVRNTISAEFNLATPNLSLESVALQANKQIARNQAFKDVPLADAGQLACASFILGKINEKTVEILHGGDCFAVWVTKTGKINIAENDYYPIDSILIDNFTRLMKQFDGDRKKAWEKHFPFLAEMKRKNANKTYAELNGQPEVEKCWTKIEIPVSDLALLICFTDGLVPFKEMEDENKLAKNIVYFFKKGGFNQILYRTRLIESQNKQSHEDHAEATGLAIKFK